MKNTQLLIRYLLVFIFLLSSKNVFSENSIFFRNYNHYFQKIGVHKFCLWVADTKDKREKGLMGVLPSQLSSKEGMIFVFLQARQLFFWMKNTPLPLDIAFLDEKGYVLNIEKMYPFSLSSIASHKKAMYAIETKANVLKKILKVGQKIDLPSHLRHNCR